jgi:hypothetical protein
MYQSFTKADLVRFWAAVGMLPTREEARDGGATAITPKAPWPDKKMVPFERRFQMELLQ